MTTPQGPLFGDKLPLIEQVTQERQEAIRLLHDGLYHTLGHYMQLMILEAGIIGVVIPVLYAQGPKLVNPWFLRRAVLWLGFSLFMGVLISAVSKWTMIHVVAKLQEHHARQSQAIGDGEDEPSIASGLQAADASFKPQGQRLLRLVRSGIIGDVLFYGAFLGGLCYLLLGFL